MINPLYTLSVQGFFMSKNRCLALFYRVLQPFSGKNSVRFVKYKSKVSKNYV